MSLRRARRSRKKKRLKWSRRSSAMVAAAEEEEDASGPLEGAVAGGREREAASSDRRNDLSSRKAVHSSRSKRELILKTSSFSPGSRAISSPFCAERSNCQGSSIYLSRIRSTYQCFDLPSLYGLLGRSGLLLERLSWRLELVDSGECDSKDGFGRDGGRRGGQVKGLVKGLESMTRIVGQISRGTKARKLARKRRRTAILRDEGLRSSQRSFGSLSLSDHEHIVSISMSFRGGKRGQAMRRTLS